ncbi:MAG: hypothetical protein ACLQIK_27180 [Mycobacterium sp.]
MTDASAYPATDILNFPTTTAAVGPEEAVRVVSGDIRQFLGI